MPIIRELLNGGVVQTRHPSLLRPGELQEADDCILRPADPSIQKAPGRTAYGTVRSSAVSCTTDGTTALTSTNGFGVDISGVTINLDRTIITKASAFGAVVVGQEVVGAAIAAGTLVRRVIDTSNVELSQVAVSSATGTVTFCNIHPGTFISDGGVEFTAGTTIASITDASNLVMSVAVGPGSSASRTFSERVEGLRYLAFDGGVSDLLVAKAADKLYTSDYAAATGTFAAIRVGMTQDDNATFETIAFKNRHVILTGFDEPRTLYYSDDGSGAQVVQERALGMKPVPDTTFVGPGRLETGTWSALPTMQNGWYYFLVTEVAKFGPEDEIESSYTGDPKGVEITDFNAQSVVVTYTKTANQPVNDGLYGRNTATHWRLYMARNDPETELPFPDLAAYRLMAEMNIADDSVVLNDGAVFQTGWASTLDSNASDDSLFPDGTTNVLSAVTKQDAPTGGASIGSPIVSSTAEFGTVEKKMVVTTASDNFPPGTTVIDDFSASSLTLSNPAIDTQSETLYFGNSDPTDDLTEAIHTNNSPTYRGGIFRDFGIQNQGGFSTAGTVYGIEVEITGSVVLQGVGQYDPGFKVTLNKTGAGGSFGVDLEGSFGKLTGPGGAKVTEVTTITVGDPGERWGLSWVPADFVDGANFGVRIRKNHGATGDTIIHGIDSVRIRIFTGIGKITLSGDPFQVVRVSDSLTAAFGSPARGAPPTASTGDIFEGMLVLNDKANPSSIVASLPDDEDAFPDVYRIPFESKERDEVTAIRHLKEILVVGTKNSVIRLNYFPREFDSEYNRGRAWEHIATDHGIVGPMAAKFIQLPQQGHVLAYLSHNGLRVTDGVRTRFLNDDLDWLTLIEPSQIHLSVLEVYPYVSIMILYYVPLGGTRKTKAMYFSYHPSHVKEGGRLPATGPINIAAGAATSAFLSGRTHLLTGHDDQGKVYLEDSGSTDDAGGSILPVIRTRRIFPGGLGKVGRLERVVILVDKDGDATTGGFSANVFRQTQSDSTPATEQTGSAETDRSTFTNEILDLQNLDVNCEGFEVKLSKTAAQSADFRLHMLAFDVADYGDETNE